MEVLLNGVLAGCLTFHFRRAPWRSFSFNVNGLQNQNVSQKSTWFLHQPPGIENKGHMYLSVQAYHSVGDHYNQCLLSAAFLWQK